MYNTRKSYKVRDLYRPIRLQIITLMQELELIISIFGNLYSDLT